MHLGGAKKKKNITRFVLEFLLKTVKFPKKKKITDKFWLEHKLDTYATDHNSLLMLNERWTQIISDFQDGLYWNASVSYRLKFDSQESFSN